MTTASELLNAVQARVDRFAAGDSSEVLDPEAVHEVRRLLQEASSDEAGLPIRVVYISAMLHLCRYLAQPDREDEEDIGRALALFGMISTVAPELVPDAVRPLLAEG